MSTKLINQIHRLDDQTAVRVLESFSSKIFDGLETPVDVMLDGVVPEVKDLTFFQQAMNLSPVEQNRPLSEEQSVEIARGLLMTFAEDPALSPVLSETLDEYSDDQLMVGPILATGVAVSMVIVAATTSLRCNFKNFEIIKDPTTPAQINAIAKLLEGIFPK